MILKFSTHTMKKKIRRKIISLAVAANNINHTLCKSNFLLQNYRHCRQKYIKLVSCKI